MKLVLSPGQAGAGPWQLKKPCQGTSVAVQPILPVLALTRKESSEQALKSLAGTLGLQSGCYLRQVGKGLSKHTKCSTKIAEGPDISGMFSS